MTKNNTTKPERNLKLPKGSRTCTSVYFDPEVYAELGKMAKEETRSISCLVNEIVTNALAAAKRQRQ